MSKPEIVIVPTSQEATERYLGAREVDSGHVTTVIEIDLPRAGTPLLVEGGRQSDYQVLVSCADERPAAARYPFDLKEPIPCCLLLLSSEDIEPVITLSALLNQACTAASLDLAIDYTSASVSALSSTDTKWLKMLGQA